MTDEWKNIVITNVDLAIHVMATAGYRVRADRPTHGFVLGDMDSSEKIYYFPDGQVLRVKPGDILFLPKGSSYRIDTLCPDSGRWVINFSFLQQFDAKPFVISPRNPAAFIELFQEAAKNYQANAVERKLLLMKNVYSIIIKLLKEQCRSYAPKAKLQLIQPALDRINSGFSDATFSVHDLANYCGVSDSYLRKLFVDCFGVPVQEYMISRRMEHAKQLLRDGQFSIAEVAQMCGYFEPSHFSRAFTRRFGVSPRAYVNALFR